MDELDLRTLWQEQPLDEAPAPSHQGTAWRDFAVPTSQFGRPPARSGIRWPLALLAVAAVLMVSVVLAAAIKFAGPPLAVRPPPRTVVLSQGRLEELLAECRTYSNTQAGIPDWSRARRACQKAIELEPISQEANQLLSRIAVLQECEQNYEGGRELLAAGRLEGALARFEKVGKGCETYLLRSVADAAPAAREVEKIAASDCLAYTARSNWKVALPRCELYARLSCQRRDWNEFTPPALMRLKLDGTLNPKIDWRPSDPVLVSFFKAREKAGPSGLWVCPDLVAFRAPPAPPDPSRLAWDELSRRYQDPELGRALVLYFRGDFHSAPVLLQKVGEQLSKAQYHEVARALLLDMNEAINLYENGVAELAAGRLEKAELVFLKALAVDERLVLGDRLATLTAAATKKELEKRVSFIRRSIVESMNTQTYEKGRALADRKDFRGACKTWKVGLTFSRSNIDLLKAATNVCTPRASEAFGGALTCEQLRAALDFAVDGDGLREEIEASLVGESCK